jgi:flagellar hook assembly protein FlgD
LEHVVKLQVPSENVITKAMIVNMSGAVVRVFSLRNGENNISWDGLDKSGKSVVPGMYAIKITAGKFTDAKVFSMVSR